MADIDVRGSLLCHDHHRHHHHCNQHHHHHRCRRRHHRHHQVQLVQDPDYQAEAILVNPPAHRLAVRLYEVNQVLWRRLSWSLWWLFWLFVNGNRDVKIEIDNEWQSWSYVLIGRLIIISGTFVTWMVLVVVINIFYHMFGSGGGFSITTVMFRWWLTPKQNWTSWSLSGTPPLFRFSWDFSSDPNICPGWPDDNGHSEARSHFRHFWLQACKCLLPHLWQRGSLIFHHSDQIFY